ncbi:calmodulin-binding transcription activator [Rhynchospora pubera]|uniref:Calmodulin-binding transcription activator n=1 Tax=Rhynchospora pubera TaxID=906938 RepID=A0AAV8HDL1_9POAL|nr:calmodulin-binding transcription activator [Rhynchospora pubera]
MRLYLTICVIIFFGLKKNSNEKEQVGSTPLTFHLWAGNPSFFSFCWGRYITYHFPSPPLCVNHFLLLQPLPPSTLQNEMQQNYDINELRKEAHARWLKPAEVFFILQNYEKYQITSEAPQKPPSGSLFLFNRRVLRFFRKDGHSWRRKKDGRTVGEAHERLKVGNVEALNCYYAHGDQNPYFQRRIYWMLNPAYEHIVLVHYREVSEGRYISLQAANFSARPSAVNSSKSQSTSNSNASNPSYSSSYVEEVSSVQNANTRDNAQPEFSNALRQLEVQLSLEDVDDYIYLEENFPSSTTTNANFHNFVGENAVDESLVQGLQLGLETSASPSWKDMFELNAPAGINMDTTSNLLDKSTIPSSSQFTEASIDGWQNTSNVHNPSDEAELRRRLSATRRFLLGSDSIDSPSQNSDKTLTENHALLRKFSSNEWMQDLALNIEEGKKDNISSPSWFDDSQFLDPHHAVDMGSSGLTLAQRQLFSIREISPEWAFSSESAKVIITGCFLCNPSDQPLAVMFGDIEVPVDIIQEGVLRCYTPPKLGPGKVTLCITSWNRESCSEVRDFEIRENQMPSATPRIAPPVANNTRTNEELPLLLKFAQLLLGKTNPDESLYGGVDLIIEELLKEKLQGWLEMKMRLRDDEAGCVLTKQEQGVIHWVSGLGYKWALSPILEAGVGINFRDSKGWTALHWAAYFGREKMVAALLAKGASATVVTDPTPQDPLGKTPGFLASLQGHIGLAAYLSEVALTTHLSSLTIEETEISKGSAELEAERAVENIAQKTIQLRGATEDELSLKDSLAAVRNASQAAARIQAAFRAFSFRKRHQNSIREVGEYGMTQEDLNEISNASRMHVPYGSKHDREKAALSIQKKYRGWKGRKNFLTVRQHVVKLQALVRGHQARKKYREFIWTVSMVEKAVIRWRRKGAGLRGFRPDPIEPPQLEPVVEDEEEEDIAKVFRKQKVDNALEEAVSRVLSMVETPDARQQYRRMIERYREAKAEMSNAEEATSMERHEFEITDGDAFMY